MNSEGSFTRVSTGEFSPSYTVPKSRSVRDEDELTRWDPFREMERFGAKEGDSPLLLIVRGIFRLSSERSARKRNVTFIEFNLT